jgi:hypothetical protein
VIVQEQQRKMDTREREGGQQCGDDEVEPALQPSLEEARPHRLLPEVDHDHGQQDRQQLLDEGGADAGGVQRAAGNHTEQHGDHRLAEQHHRPPADAEPPSERPREQRP